MKTKQKLEKILKYDSNGKPKLELKPLKRTVVNTKSQKDYDNLMQVYEAGDWKWKSCDVLPTKYNKWIVFQKGSCIEAGVDSWKKGTYNNGRFGYSHKAFYQEHGWNILSSKDFLSIEMITPEILKELNKWFDKYKPNRESKG